MTEHSPDTVRRARFGRAVAQYFLRLACWLWFLHLTAWVLFDLLPSPEYGIAGWAGIDPLVLSSTRERLGLQGSSFERYWTSLLNLLHGDFGRSVVGGYPVAEIFVQRLFNSIPQWFASLFLLFIIPIPLGMIFCSRITGRVRAFMLFSAHSLLIPQFLACCAGQAAFVLLISPTLQPEFDDLTRRIFAVISATVGPVAIAFIAAANTAASCAQQPFVTTYLAAGLSWWQIRTQLIINVLIAMKPLLGRLAHYVILGSVFSEALFSIKGVGSLFWDSLRSSDIPMMMAFVLFAGSVTLAVSTLETASR